MLVSSRVHHAGGQVSNVDIYNGATGLWKFTFLSAARSLPMATSLPGHGLAFFAGGFGGEADA